MSQIEATKCKLERERKRERDRERERERFIDNQVNERERDKRYNQPGVRSD